MRIREIGRKLPPPRRRQDVYAVGAIVLTVVAVALLARLITVRLERLSPASVGPSLWLPHR